MLNPIASAKRVVHGDRTQYGDDVHGLLFHFPPVTYSSRSTSKTHRLLEGEYCMSQCKSNLKIKRPDLEIKLGLCLQFCAHFRTHIAQNFWYNTYTKNSTVLWQFKGGWINKWGALNPRNPCMWCTPEIWIKISETFVSMSNPFSSLKTPIQNHFLANQLFNYSNIFGFSLIN